MAEVRPAGLGSDERVDVLGRIVDPVLSLGGGGEGERGGRGDREGREPVGNVGASNGLDVVLARKEDLPIDNVV
ncbi:hypothetical protein E1202_13570 [Saccharopolyspora karakumensis]|uniref:Uncharacterized protein n=1 Tax=Saccharopolyspora karakumensis TaxID=2530386 RepID=A0A4R5BNZ4_9PSEU|nr:hypothetical protein [Saccharopolyspora karakumensis]TDD88598.1 hypothetical protein E1202_13570 [Saccharopolyspora karakumensis]